MSSAALAPTPTIHRPNVVQVGTIVWLGSEVMFFAGIFAIYFTLRGTSPELWVESTEHLNVPYAAVNTAILVISSFWAQFGVFAAERMQVRRTGSRWNFAKWGATEWFYLTYLFGAVFVVGQIYEYANLVSEGLTFGASAYSTIFYFSTGLHALHVSAGLIAFLFVIGRFYAVKRFTHKEATSSIAISYYWHFVDVVWLGLFFVIYILK